MTVKTRLAIATAIALCFVGCRTSGTDIEIESDKLYPVEFTVGLEKEILPFPSAKSMPPIDVPDPEVPKVDPPTDKLYNRIEYLVYKSTPDKTLALVHHRQFISTDDDFSIVYDSLPAGNYTISFFAHSSEPAKLERQELCFDKVSDTFQASETFDIGGAEVLTKEILLERIVSRIEFVSDKPVPATLSRFDMTVNPYFSRANTVTGNGVDQTEEETISHTFASEELGQTGLIHSFYTFVSTGSKVQVKLEPMYIGKPTQTRVVEGVVPIRNKIIRYRGNIYNPTSENQFTLEILNDGVWDEPDSEIPLD